jgi:hypothetical protein
MADEELLKTLKERFAKHPGRHLGLDWNAVHERLAANPAKVQVVAEMERTGGEPDVIGFEAGAFVFCDCAAESPAGRRSLCYDRAALDARKENKPSSSAVEMAAVLGVELLDEAAYRELQKLGEFDKKTSSWVRTPSGIRSLGGALFCDRRYDTVFVYHNGADSYYGARGFRGTVKV